MRMIGSTGLTPASLLGALALLAASGTAAFAAGLTEAEIRTRIIGHTIYLAAPMGGEFPLNYRASGVVDGDGKALGIGKLIKPSDTGKWWIADDRLCQQFTTWYKGAKMCFDLTDAGADKVKWVRDDGESGIARIGD